MTVNIRDNRLTYSELSAEYKYRVVYFIIAFFTLIKTLISNLYSQSIKSQFTVLYRGNNIIIIPEKANHNVKARIITGLNDILNF